VEPEETSNSRWSPFSSVLNFWKSNPSQKSLTEPEEASGSTTLKEEKKQKATKKKEKEKEKVKDTNKDKGKEKQKEKEEGKEVIERETKEVKEKETKEVKEKVTKEKEKEAQIIQKEKLNPGLNLNKQKIIADESSEEEEGEEVIVQIERTTRKEDNQILTERQLEEQIAIGSTDMRNIVVFAGSSHKGLADIIINRLGIELGKLELGFFSNNETKVEIKQNVRNKDVFIIQSGCGMVNDNLMELLILIHACKIASAKRIIAVIPCFPYGRQPTVPFKQQNHTHHHDGEMATADKGTDPTTEKKPSNYDMWQARSGTLVANMLSGAGVEHVITLDLHDPQFQGFFDIPLDNLFSQPLMLKYIYDNIPNPKDVVIVSPDSGGAKRATSIAEKLGVEFGLVHRDKKYKNETIFVGDVNGKIAILIDDIIDTGNTICQAANTLSTYGATKIFAIVTHAILSGEAIEKIDASKLDELIVSDSVPQDENKKKTKKLKTFTIAPLFAEAIRRIHNGESVSFLFDHVPYS